MEDSSSCSFDSLEIRFVLFFLNVMLNTSQLFLYSNLEMEEHKVHHWSELIVEQLFCHDLNRFQITCIFDSELIRAMKTKVSYLFVLHTIKIFAPCVWFSFLSRFQNKLQYRIKWLWWYIRKRSKRHNIITQLSVSWSKTYFNALILLFWCL